MLLILRHGETEWNVADRMQGRLDSPLTALGRRQALAQGAVLAAHGASRLPLHCSPQGRARETAALALPGVAVRFDERLCEIALGAWQGLTSTEIRAGWPEAFIEAPDRPGWKFAAPGGEDLAAMTARVDDFLAEVAGPAIIVTHGVTSQLLRARLLGLPPTEASRLDDRQGVVYRVVAGGQEVLHPGRERYRRGVPSW